MSTDDRTSAAIIHRMDVPAPGLCRCACRRNHGVKLPVCRNVPAEGDDICQPCRAWSETIQHTSKEVPS